MNNNKERKKEVVSICLNKFLEKGLNKTSSRDLSEALNVQNAGLYYYFKSKQDVVTACCEEAVTRLEFGLIIPAIVNIDSPNELVEGARAGAEELSSLFQFYIVVCSSQEYKEKVKSIVQRSRERDKGYIKEIVRKLKCSSKDAYQIYIAFKTALMHFMIYKEESYFNLQMKMIADYIEKILL